MEFMFYAVPSLIAALALFMAAKTITRWLEVRRAWNSGLTAEARCLRTYTTTRRDSDSGHTYTTLHHVYEFTTRDGRSVRFEEADGPGTVIEGDVVVVHYAAERPEKATARPVAPVKAGLALAGILVFLGVVIAFCAGFMVTAANMFF
ncbi:DUF3592 domain-containing protein [Streptomyces sp. NPDC058001]|uniref:DUF3592 domain-containing protein n=1 Tax=Streptomyces sp. NPDC058001 TaxID=3346300 RepID=UPI0036EDAFAF